MIWIWLGFMVLVVGMLALDLGIFHHTDHVISLKESLAWTAVWVGMAMAFGIFIYFAYEYHWAGLGAAINDVDGTTTGGKSAAIKYLTGYVLEKSLSMDNLFVISAIFGTFAVPLKYQHRVLFWGVIGAILMRAVMIFIGAELIESYHWVIYLLGIFLIVTAIRMLAMKTSHARVKQNIIVRLARRILPVTDQFHGKNFIVRRESLAGIGGGKVSKSVLAVTPLALALIAVETADVLFAVDSIPAIFAITTDPFLVFTSNIFAILGLRSLYFALAGMIDKFRYLPASLAIVLAVVGVKMLTARWLRTMLGPGIELWLLAAVFLILIVGIAASWMADRPRGANGRTISTVPDASPPPAQSKEA